MVTILFQHGDPNKYLDLAIALSSIADTPSAQSEAFRFCTPVVLSGKVTGANRKKYVRHCFALLEQIDDGQTGQGYFLALHVGEFLRLPPNAEGRNAFTPDPQWLQYQDPHGLKDRFFQDTVINARKWWNENKAPY